MTDAEIKRMKDEAAANAESDAKVKEKIDKLNHADSLIFQTEKQLTEIGDKIPADKKGPIEVALAKLKEAHKTQDIPTLDEATNELNTAFQAASQEMYNAQNAQDGQAQQNPDFGGHQENQSESKQKGDVTDVYFEEVK